jgi:hypothetical protein
MLNLNIPYKQVSRIEGLENFVGYYIDINGNVWSTKGKSPRIIRPFYAGKKTKKYNKVCLCNEGKCIYVYVHILMAKAFIPKAIRKKYTCHLSSDTQDNRLENIITLNKKKGWTKEGPGRPKKTQQEFYRETVVTDEMIEKVKLVHRASIIKGLPVSDSYGFLEEIIEELLDEYCTRKGLRRIIHQMSQEEN